MSGAVAQGVVGALLNEVGFKHPMLDETSAVREAMISELGPQLESIVYGPNFYAGPQRAPVALQRAFHGDRFRGIGEPTGYALRLSGALLLTRERVRLVFGGRDAAMGVSQYKIVGLPGVLERGSPAEIERFMDSKRASLPRLMNPAAHVFVTKTRRSARDADEYFLLVKDTNVPSARRFNEWLLASAARGQPKRLSAAARSTAYAQVHRNAQLWRNYVARLFARTLGIELGSLVRTTVLTTVRPYNQIAHGVHSADSRGSETFVVFNNLASAADAHDGTSLLYRGALAGYTELRNSQGERAWYQPHYLSILPGDTGRVYKQFTVRGAAHPGDSDAAAADFNARVVWNSDFGDHLVHAAAQHALTDLADPFTAKWLEHLAPSDTRTLPLETQEHAMVVGQISDVPSHYTSPATLARVARMPNAPASIPLAVDHELVQKIPALYDSVIKPSGYGATLPQIFGRLSTSEQERVPGGYATLYTGSALTYAERADLDAIGFTDDDLVYNDEIAAEAAELGMSAQSGCHAKHSAAHHISHYDDATERTANSGAAPEPPRLAVSRSALIDLRNSVRGSSAPLEEHPVATLINIDTALLRIITPGGSRSSE